MRGGFLRVFGSILLDGLLLTVLLCALTGTSAAQSTAAVRYVAPAGKCGGKSPCYATVQLAVDAAGAGDEIRVAAGAYRGVSASHGASQALYLSKEVIVRGAMTP